MKPQLFATTAVVMCLALAACNKTTKTADAPASSTTTTTTTTAPADQTASGSSSTASTPDQSASAMPAPSTTDTAVPGATTDTTTPSDQAAANDTATGTSTDTASSSSSLPAETTADGFVQRVAVSDMFEVQASQAILAKTGIDAKVRTFAQKMVTAHTDSTKQLKTIAAGESLTLPTVLDTEHQAMLDQIKSANGAAAVNLYLDQQTNAHEAALTLLQNYSSNGDDTQLKQFAMNLTPAVQMHLTDAKALKAAAPASPNM